MRASDEDVKLPPSWLIALCWLGVLAGAAFLRFDKLADRPFHFDEATGARITSQRVEPGSRYQFNPEHNHGPLLSALGAPICRLRGEATWQEMNKLSLRLVPAIGGTLLVLVPLVWRRRFGDLPMLAAAALLATSPLLVYFSRIYIHEMLLALCGLAALVLALGKPRFALAGFFVGLMFATKESFAISILAWGGAGVVLGLLNLRELRPLNLRALWAEYRKLGAIALAVALLTSFAFYTDGLRNPAGAWDAVKTFFVYKTGEGHDKGIGYYLGMLAVPTKAAIWWHEAPVFLLAVIALVRAHLPRGVGGASQRVVQFVGYATILHLLIYSLIPYKTPWLMCLPWAHACLLAGLSLQGIHAWKRTGRVLALVVLLIAAAQQARLARLAAGRFASDSRNPYAYAPTSSDVESVRKWMRELSTDLPEGALEPIGVVGSEYWPLPWYLRDFEAIGYWPQPTEAIDGCPVVFAMPEVADEVGARLEMSHVALPRTLRAQVTVMLFLRKDHWDQWMNSEN